MKNIKQYLLNNYDKVKINSKEVIRGDVFIALPGNYFHGNDFIKEAISKGAQYIITDKSINHQYSSNFIILVNNTLEYLYKIAVLKRKNYKGEVIGITGSIGKTSLKENLKYFLLAKFKISASIKSYNNYLGVVISLLNLNNSSNFAIFEMGTNNFCEIRKLTSLILPSQVIITNIFPTHLENFINTRNIAIEKSDIFDKQYNPNVKLLILPNTNIDERFLNEKAKNRKNCNIVTFGEGINSDLCITKIESMDLNFSKVYFKFEQVSYNFLFDRNYLHKISNFLICFIFFIKNKIDLNIFLSLTQHVPNIEGRGLQTNINFNNKKITFIDESYNASPETMNNSINFLLNFKSSGISKKFLILGEMKELGTHSLAYHIDLINYLSDKNFYNIIICGELFKLALEKTFNNKIVYMDNISSILEYLDSQIKNNDILLIKGSNSSLTKKLTNEILRIGGK